MRPAGLADYLRKFEHLGGIIVCEQRKFIYMKATRTGGTSILREVLEPAIPSIIHFKDTPRPFSRWLQRITDELLDEYCIFSFVRNPWDRFVSIAFYFKVPVEQLARELDRYRQRESIRTHSVPLHRYTHFDGRPFADFIGRFENLQADFDRLCDRLALPLQRLPHASKTRHEHYSRYYDAALMNDVAEIYAKDIELFDYRFDIR